MKIVKKAVGLSSESV